MPTGDGSVPPEKPMMAGQQTLDKGATQLMQLMQSLKPVRKMSKHVCTFAMYNHDVTRQIWTHCYMTCVNQEFLQCPIYDSDDSNARLIGVIAIHQDRISKVFADELVLFLGKITNELVLPLHILFTQRHRLYKWVDNKNNTGDKEYNLVGTDEELEAMWLGYSQYPVEVHYVGKLPDGRFAGYHIMSLWGDGNYHLCWKFANDADTYTHVGGSRAFVLVLDIPENDNIKLTTYTPEDATFDSSGTYEVSNYQISQKIAGAA